MSNIKEEFLVFGNPIAHSKSPLIHQKFAEQTGIAHHYDKLCVPLDKFEDIVHDFFSDNGKGANVTLPFKERAYSLVDSHTPEAFAAGAVNTLIKLPDGQLLGDNTDGAGLVQDLIDREWIFEGARVLLLGAGGAAKGAILPLLKEKVEITLVNRTYEKALELVGRFKEGGFIKADSYYLKALEYRQLEGYNYPFDLIINATAASLSSEVPPIPACAFTLETAIYDMFYGKEETSFLKHFHELGCEKRGDGLGMLVYQAALAFLRWHGKMPDAKKVLAEIKSTL